MEAVGAASAIIGIAQLGLQFSQVLVTVIGDYRDAAKNINRIRDEIHLASICLRQLGDLASRDLLTEYGILEATNLRERCQAVFWEIRGKVKKGDHPLHPTEITKEQIDVTYFTSLKWALWTKKQLDEPRQELDRLKDSMTLCFVSHMAILATSDLEKARYASQIPGIKRSLAWSEKMPNDDVFRHRLEAAGIPPDKISEILGDDAVTRPASPAQILVPVPTESRPSQTSRPSLRAYSLDPLAITSEIPVSQDWITQFLEQNSIGDSAVWKIHSKLHPWFKNELDTIFKQLNTDDSNIWNLVFIKPTFKNIFSHGLPRNVQVVMRALPKETVPVEQRIPETIMYAMNEPISVAAAEISEDTPGEIIVQEPATFSNEYVQIEPRTAKTEETDEEMIASQLALYQ